MTLPDESTENGSPAPTANAFVGDVVPIPTLPVDVNTMACDPLSFIWSLCDGADVPIPSLMFVASKKNEPGFWVTAVPLVNSIDPAT